MGKIIQRTFTITITETWTITWTEDAQAEDEPQRQAGAMMPKQPKTQEEPDESLQATVVTAESDKPSANASLSPPLTPAVSLDPQSDGVSIGLTRRGKGRRIRRREAGRNQPSD